MPGVMAHSSTSSIPHALNLKLSLPEVASTSVIIPSLIILTLTMYSLRTWLKDQVIIYFSGCLTADSLESIPPTRATAENAFTFLMPSPRVMLLRPGAKPIPSRIVTSFFCEGIRRIRPGSFLTALPDFLSRTDPDVGGILQAHQRR